MKKPRKVRCAWCRAPVEQPARGRPRLYCGVSCRQRAYEERRLLREHGTRLASLARRAKEGAAEQKRVERRLREAFDAAIEACEAGGPKYAARRRRELFGR